MLNFLIGFIVGGAIGIIITCIVSINKEHIINSVIIESEVRSGLSGVFPFTIKGTHLEITPRQDGSGVIRFIRRDDI